MGGRSAGASTGGRSEHLLDLHAQENSLTSLFGYRKTTGWTGTPGMKAPVEGRRDTFRFRSGTSPARTARLGLGTEWASRSEATGCQPWTPRASHGHSNQTPGSQETDRRTLQTEALCWG